MDYAGQRLSENIYYFLTIFFGAIAWIAGYIKADFYVTFWGWLVGLVLSLIICIPDWPIFNRKPVVWLEKIGQKNSSSSSTGKTAPSTAPSSSSSTSASTSTAASIKPKKDKKNN